MEQHILPIVQFIGRAFLHIWPYLLVTIPIAVVVRLVGGSQYISRIFQRRPISAILMATIVGAVSPFCSCGVIPVVASLLIGGVPLAPVMSFWVASPSMDPEMFFLSVSMVGWELAIWRLAATLFLSLGAGLVTHFMVKRGWLGDYVLSARKRSAANAWTVQVKKSWALAKRWVLAPFRFITSFRRPAVLAEIPCCTSSATSLTAPSFIPPRTESAHQHAAPIPLRPAFSNPTASNSTSSCGCGQNQPLPWHKRVVGETVAATMLVVKFMALAFFIEALITLYVPAEWVSALLGHKNHGAIIWATLIGVPAYTSNLTALPMISGLLVQGMDRGAALAFLIAGPTTTLPAMAAVWGLVSRRVFLLYVSIALLGSLVVGYAYSLAHLLF